MPPKADPARQVERMQEKPRAVWGKSSGMLCKEEGLQKCSGSPGAIYQSQDPLITQAEAGKKT